MRLRITLHAERPMRVPFSHQELLSGLVYRLLGVSSAEYARFLHDEGYGSSDEMRRRFKLFTFSTLRAGRSVRRMDERGLLFGPGLVEWYVSSPLPDFLTHSATGLLAEGEPLRVGPSAVFTVRAIDAVSTPQFGDHTAVSAGTARAKFTCWTPLVASVASPDGRKTPYYLRPTADADAFSEAVRKNLLQKYALVHHAPPPDDRLTLAFDAAYLARSPHGGTKKITIHQIDVIGAEAPFTLTGSPDLLRLAWETGLGEKNSMGFGMIEAAR